MSVKEHIPIFIVKIGEQFLTEEITNRISAFTYEDNEKELDKCTVEIQDASAILNNPNIREGATMKVRWGYPGRLSDEKILTLKEPEVFFTDAGIKANLVAYDKGHKLTGRVVQKHWDNVTIQEIVEKIAAKHGFETLIDDASDKVNEFQADSDSAFLKDLAARMGYSMYVEGNTLHFHREQRSAAPFGQYIWGERTGRLIDFKTKVHHEDEKGKKTEITARGINPETKEIFEERINQGNVGDSVLASSIYGLDDAMGETKLVPLEETGHLAFSAAGTTKDAKRRARSKFKKNRVQANATVLGDPALKAKGVYLFHGVGANHSGNWYAIKVLHKIDDKYTCTFDLEREGPGSTFGGVFGLSSVLANLQSPFDIINGKIESIKNSVVKFVNGEEEKVERKIGGILG